MYISSICHFVLIKLKYLSYIDIKNLLQARELLETAEEAAPGDARVLTQRGQLEMRSPKTGALILCFIFRVQDLDLPPSTVYRHRWISKNIRTTSQP